MSSSNNAAPFSAPLTKVITLLEQNKLNENDPPGTFSLNLAESLVLKEGESLSISNSFVDTTTQGTDFINVSKDETDITITHGIYMADIEGVPSAAKPVWFNGTVPLTERPDGRKYIMQNQSEAFLNTYFDWPSQENAWGGLGVSSDFSIELDAILDDTYGFEYNVTGVGIPLPTPTPVPAANYQLQAEYIIGGHMVLHHTLTSFEFWYYPRGYVPPSGKVGDNDHTAIFSKWIVNGKQRGWKAIGNPNGPTAIPENQKWLFKSSITPPGYNYFDSNGRAHIRECTTLKIPINKRWSPPSSKDPHQYPALQISWTDQHGVAQRQPYEFTNYPPDWGPSPDRRAGTQEVILKVLGPDRIPFTQPVGGTGDVVPDFLQGRKNNWNDGDANPSWEWYRCEQNKNKGAPDKPPVFTKFLFDINQPILIQYYYKNPDIDTAFVNNQAAQYSDQVDGMICVPWQIESTPVINPQSTGSVLVPRLYETKISIPQGDYTYDALAQILTDRINAFPRGIVKGVSNNPNDLTQPVNVAGFTESRMNPSTYELMMQYNGFTIGDEIPTFPTNYIYSDVEQTVGGVTIPPKTPTDVGFQPFFVSEDGQDLFQFDSTGLFPTPSVSSAQLIGASSFSIIFDESSQTYQIEQAHSNIYVDGPNKEAGATNAPPGPQVVKQLKVPAAAASVTNSFLGNLAIADVASGVYITDMQPESLFLTKMRFNKRMYTDVSAGNTSIKNFSTGFTDFALNTRLIATQCHGTTLTTGVNITGFYVGADALIQKSSTFTQVDEDWNEYIEDSTPVGLVGDPILQISDDQAFYQIEISGINNQDIHLAEGVAKNNLIQAYVGKYFTSGAFTSSSEPGFEYVHKGQPLTISSLRVRILDTQGNLEPGLGDHSAVVLQLNTSK